MSRKQAAIVRETTKATARPHQLGQTVFRAILPEEIDWKPFAAFPPSVHLAVVVGQPLQGGPYTIRVRVLGGVKLMPHGHPEDRVNTVLSGIIYIGLGDHFDVEKLVAYPPGAVIVLPGDTSPLPLGKVRRVHHPGDGDWAVWPLNTSTRRTIPGIRTPPRDR